MRRIRGALAFANRDEAAALHSVLDLLDAGKDGRLTDEDG